MLDFELFEKVHLRVARRQACLDHLLTQTFRDFEVVLVDNGSEDSVAGGLKGKYSSLDLRIERLNTNRGFAAAKNIGARLTCGKWLALLNADAL